MTPLDAFAGRLLLQPGQALPNIQRLGVRRAERLALGRPADTVPALLGTLFTLCGHAHVLTARRAVEAARAAPGSVLAPPPPADARTLQLHTAQEQVRRLLVDAPPVVELAPATPVMLQRCPLWQPGPDADATLAALAGWMEEDLLAMPADAWLAAWERDGATWLQDWAGGARSPVARLLRRLWPWASALRTPHRALRLNACDGSAAALAARLAAEAPLQGSDGVPFATGPWCRAHGRDQAGVDNAWMLFASRLSDLVRLASADGPATGALTLDCGALNTGGRSGLAWTETARGLLVHRIALAANGSVAACRVVSPTDWNFDPHGPAAQALRQVHEQRAVQSLVLALDPCMAWEAQPRQETTHA
jgi:hypothetical protein